MVFSDKVSEIVNTAFVKAGMEKNEYLTPEHLLYTMLAEEPVENAVYDCGGDVDIIKAQLEDFFSEKLPKHDSYEIAVSNSANEVFEKAARQAASAGKNQIELPHVMKAITDLKESYAVYYLIEEVGDFSEFLAHLNEEIDEMNQEEEEDTRRALPGHEGHGNNDKDGEAGEDDDDDDDEIFIISDETMDGIWEEEPRRRKRRKSHLSRYVTCLNETVSDHNPLIGREKELERTIQVLCCRDKNNPLHIGEAGVGKTSITYGLASMIVHGQVPESLKDARIFRLDLNAVVAGAQYRGQFEQRVQEIMSEIAQEKNPIVFIDEIHTIVGAGDYSGSSDAASLLKPWFEDPHVRFIGSTTYEDYNRSISKNKTLIRRFQNIDIEEPSVAETIDILEGIRDRYEKHHGIIYGEGFMEEAVNLASRYMSDRFLPDKAIALIDEAGAILQLHPELADGRTQEGILIAGTSLAGIAVSRICHIPETRLTAEAEDSLLTLKDRISSQVFGQDEAISQMVYAVQTSRLGLQAEHKPVASLLFVGPTGVGKTESAKVLAAELGVSFLRFDMSEYTERHTVAKLIGSPAGYVGYEDGGQLIDAVRKNPYSVLLLDEIEKAHSDIFNVLLQVMDYATLTDSHGRKADFSHVILIMTSNAGAASVGKALIGFGERSVMESNMMDEVKRIFAPEFRNRLSGVLVFNKLSKEMAMRIVKKKTAELAGYLEKRGVQATFTDALYAYILETGYSPEFGAREIDRAIADKLTPYFVKALLEHRISEGDAVTIDYRDGSICLAEEAEAQA